MPYIPVGTLSSAVQLFCSRQKLSTYIHVCNVALFSSLAPAGEGDKGPPLALLILTMEQAFSSINALVLTFFRLAQSCVFKWFGYISIVNQEYSEAS